MNAAAQCAYGPGPQSNQEIIQRATSILTDLLPPTWTLRVGSADPRVDAIYVLTAPDGGSVNLIMETKRVIEGRDVPSIAQQIAGFTQNVFQGHGVVTARYLSPQVRSLLKERNLSYVDATGNVHIAVSTPGLLIVQRGADGDPWRGPGRPRGTLKGVPAARMVRAITDFAGEWPVRELARTAQVSVGSAYRVVDFLEREGLVERKDRGLITVPRWDKVLRRWSEDYGFVRDSRITRWIAPRGLDDLLRRAARTDTADYVVTGSLAASEWAALAPVRSAMIYTHDARTVAAAWELRPADAGANVMLAEPHADVPFARGRRNAAGVQIAAPAQVVTDLMTGPGRSPQEAEELIEWMLANERSWRAER